MKKELEGLDYSWESGSKHWLLRVRGRLIAIWPRGGVDENAGRNMHGTITAIRRAKRGVVQT